MSLFGSRTKIYVSSSIYNMAGDYDERTDYLKYLVLNGVLSNSGKTIGETIASGTLNGPRMNYQTFFRWAKRNYEEGMPEGGVFGTTSIDPSIVQPFIPVPSGSEVVVELVDLGFDDYWQWAYAYMNENHQDLIDTDWGAEIDETSPGNFLITIIFEDESVETFVPSGFVPREQYVYARYHIRTPPENDDPVFISAGSVLGPYDNSNQLPNTNDFYLADELEQTGQTLQRHTIERITKTYSNGDPTVVEETKTVVENISYNRLFQIFEKYNSIETDPLDETRGFWKIDRINIWQAPAYDVELVSSDTEVNEISPGVFETVVTEEFEEVMRSSGSQWYAQEEVWEKDAGKKTDNKLFIYQIGSGTEELDELISEVTPMDGYFPMIPVRTDNKMVDEEPHLTNIYDIAAKAWKRASSGKKFTKLLDQVKDNPDLEDIDFAFVIWGVALNTLTREGKLYIYKFFKEMMLQQTADMDDFLLYEERVAAYQQYLDDLSAYYSQEYRDSPPPTEPEKPLMTMPAKTTLRTHGSHPETQHYDFRLSWNAITETVHTGKWEPEAKINEVSITKGEPFQLDNGFQNGFNEEIYRYVEQYDRLIIRWQETEDQYRELTVIGALHQNVVYRGKSVDIKSNEALDDSEDSGFIIPLHYSILKSMPVVWANQLALEGMLIVFNCYVIVRKKWYQTFLGQILIGLFTMGVGAIFSGGASLLAGGGILGSNIAVGSMFGLTGMAGALAGAAINSMVMTTIMAIIQEVAGSLGALGAIFSAIAGIVMGGLAASAMGAPGGFSFEVFLRADNLLKLTNGVISAYSIHVQEKTQDIYSEIRDLDEAYKKQKREIDQLMYDLTGFSSGIDPMIMTDILQDRNENRDAFNQRTLMTGSDIAMLTHNLINSFADISLDLEAMKG